MRRPWAWPLLCLLLTACPSFQQGPVTYPLEKGDQFMEVRGVRMRVRVEGQGPAVVLIHGFASSLDVWEPLLPALAKGHRVLAMDLKGFGRSDKTEGDYSPWEEAMLVRELMDRAGMDQAHLVAHSWGCSVALAFALSYPKRVRGLVLVDGWVYSDQLPSFFLHARRPVLGEALFGLFYKQRPGDRMAMAFANPDILSQRLMDDVEAALERPGAVAAALAATRGQRFEEWEDRYREVKAPTLLIWGREDMVSRLAFGERLHKDLQDSRLLVLPRCGHFPMIEQAASFNRAVLGFVSGHMAVAP